MGLERLTTAAFVLSQVPKWSQPGTCDDRNGKRNPTLEKIYAVANALGVSHVELVLPSEDNQPPPAKADQDMPFCFDFRIPR